MDAAGQRRRATGHFGEREIVELIVTAGWYHVIAYLSNGLRVEPEPWAPRFPDRAPTPA